MSLKKCIEYLPNEVLLRILKYVRYGDLGLNQHLSDLTCNLKNILISDQIVMDRLASSKVNLHFDIIWLAIDSSKSKLDHIHCNTLYFRDDHLIGTTIDFQDIMFNKYTLFITNPEDYAVLVKAKHIHVLSSVTVMGPPDEFEKKTSGLYFHYHSGSIAYSTIWNHQSNTKLCMTLMDKIYKDGQDISEQIMSAIRGYLNLNVSGYTVVDLIDPTGKCDLKFIDIIEP